MGKKKKEVKEKPLEKMTAKELREVGKQIPEIKGVFGMNKPELISVIKRREGLKKTPRKRRPPLSAKSRKRLRNSGLNAWQPWRAVIIKWPKFTGAALHGLRKRHAKQPNRWSVNGEQK